MFNKTEVGRISPKVRERMVETLQKKGITNPKVISAMKKIKRHYFVDEILHHKSYENSSLPIGDKQTISQPIIVAIMTEALLGKKDSLGKVLEIGTGSGYQAAILSQIATEVYSVERIEELIPKARNALEKSNINNVQINHADGFNGWQNQQPFDGILVTAATQGVPKALFEQLNIGSRIIIPVDADEDQQVLLEVTKTENNYEYRQLTNARFVPMTQGVI